MEAMLPMFEQIDAIDPRTELMAPTIAAAIYESRLDLKRYDFIPEAMIEAFRQKKIIGIRESFSAFQERCDWDLDASLWGGDWEYVLDESLVDVYKRGRDSFEGVRAAQATLMLLRNAKNREEAQNFWTVTLDKLHPILLSACQDMSAGAAPNRKPSKRKVSRPTGRYDAIDKTLRDIAAARPRSHDEVFEALNSRKIRVPGREPFKSAGGWMKGFRLNRHDASAWLSQRWRALDLPAFARGPK
jgi:hypothetical protein